MYDESLVSLVEACAEVVSHALVSSDGNAVGKFWTI